MLVVAAGIALLSLPGIARRWLKPIDPARAVALTRLALAGGLVLVVSGLVSMVAPTLLEDVGAHHLVGICRRVLHDVLSLGHPGGFAALLTLVVISARMLSAMRRTRAAQSAILLEPWIGRQRRMGDYRLVVIDTPVPIAAAARDQIVVSSSLEDILDSEQLDVLLRHEVAHVRGQHHRHLTAAAALDSVFGWLRPIGASLAALRLGLERWADEEAVGTDPRMREVMSAALSTVATTQPAPGLAGFSNADMVSERILALKTRPRAESRSMSIGAGVVAALTGTMWLGAAGSVVISLSAWGPCAV